ncbi:RluA family pseudouridine synthase [Maritalea mediterranea]|uniref:Pseudouridine synthase n=1 Tax=Maritalea mediterranea TaxID=2909667 RepID=A0ABS9EC22_9HYPH|nr:RluA family pseudouridine synthase [Maritalea mediterranea]MCF4099714.1 RluA family pseudouridine synthase [Maritalea mediterranea]
MTASSSDAQNMLNFTVPPEWSGKRLDVVVAHFAEEISRSRCQDLIRQKTLTIDGATISEPKYRVKQDQQICLTLPQPIDAVPAAQQMELDVLFEDDALIVVNKAANMVVHPAPGSEEGTLVNALLHHCGDSLSGIGGVKRPGIVHRLDKDTTGVMVVAKTEQAHNHLAAQFADHGRTGPLEREYLALVWGEPRPDKGKIETLIGRDPKNRIKQAVLKSGGRNAITHFKLDQVFGGHKWTVSRVKCRLETGRTHQIRVHMAHLGHPLLGDAAYGAGVDSKKRNLPMPAQMALKGLNRQALHAALLGFEHPTSGEKMRFTAPLPEDMQELENALSAENEGDFSQ